MLPKFADLTHVHRGNPCQEYPGEWLLFQDGKEIGSHSNFDAAWKAAQEMLGDVNFQKLAICWKCTDGDPRVGKVWFSGFYRHGYFNQWAVYVNG